MDSGSRGHYEPDESDWLKVILLVVGALLTAGLAIMVREWYQPDVRYVVGGWYRLANLAVAGTQLHNKGHADAENIVVTATFTNPLIDIATNDVTIPFTSSSGGIGHNTVTGTMTRLVPNEAVEIYFVTKPSSPWVDQGAFIKGIKFNGGLGKTGTPWLHWILAFLMLGTWCVVWGVGLKYMIRRTNARHYRHLREAIQLGSGAAHEGLSEERLKARIEEWYGKIAFLPKTVKEDS